MLVCQPHYVTTGSSASRLFPEVVRWQSLQGFAMSQQSPPTSLSLKHLKSILLHKKKTLEINFFFTGIKGANKYQLWLQIIFHEVFLKLKSKAEILTIKTYGDTKSSIFTHPREPSMIFKITAFQTPTPTRQYLSAGCFGGHFFLNQR